MCKIILPIKPKYSNDILNNIKHFELRRSIPKREVHDILIYETSPTSKVVGTISINKTHYLPLKELWELTRESNSLTKKEFMSYFKGKTYGYAYEVNKRERFSKAKNLNRYGVQYPPQGFIYYE